MIFTNLNTFFFKMGVHCRKSDHSYFKFTGWKYGIPSISLRFKRILNYAQTEATGLTVATLFRDKIFHF